MSTYSIQSASFGLALFAFGCSDGGGGKSAPSEVPWEENGAQAINADRTTSTVNSVAGEDCDVYEGSDRDICTSIRDRCGERAGDVVLDEEGKAIDSVCYPAAATVTVEEVEAQNGDIAQNQNDTVIALDDADDGIDLEGNLDVDANNVVVYGAGPDVSVISGDVTVDGNNTVIRGVRIQGNVEVLKNDAVFLFCVIEGNLTIPANNARLLACDVYGDVIVTGNGTELVSDRIAGQLTNEGMGTSCESVVEFDDVDGDLHVTDDELGGAVSCGGKPPKK